ncbi:MAG: formate dehydrogenase accessory protein FdhE [Candidatus Eisenbacteria bacterium]
MARVRSGRPWVDRAGIDFEPDRVSEILRGILEDLRLVSRGLTPDLERIRALAEKDESAPAGLLEAILSNDSTRVDQLATKTEFPSRLLRFLGGYLARPFLAAAVRGFDPESVDANLSNASCPACGCTAELGFLMPENGKRHLWCRHCGTDWAVLRLKCPVCSNTDGETLGYFVLEGDRGRRVDFCRRCGRYMKTIDARETGGGDPFARADIENLSSEELDTAAAHEGFEPAAGACVPALVTKGETDEKP